MPPAPSNELDVFLNGSDLKTALSNLDPSVPSSTQYLARARSLCAEYLGGIWNHVPIEEFRLKSIKGGLSNILFLAELPTHSSPLGKEPKCSLIRFRSEKDIELNHHESLIFTILSERNIGPRLLGSFSGGRLEEFIPSRPLLCNEISLPHIARQMAQRMAQVHVLDAPVSKRPDHLKYVRKWLTSLKETSLGTSSIQMYTTQAKVDPSEYPSTISIESLYNELEFVENFMLRSGSPVVLCHNDICGQNTLFRYNVPEGENPLFLIDYEFATYNYRGFDLGQYFNATGLDFDTDVPYLYYNEKFEDHEVRQIFCRAYVDEVYRLKLLGNSHFPSDLITGNYETDLEKLLEESYCFLGCASLFFGCWALFYAQNGLRLNQEDQSGFNYASYGRDRLALYFHQKRYITKFFEKIAR